MAETNLTDRHPEGTEPEQVAAVVDNVLGLGGFSFVGLDRRQVTDAVGRFASALVRRPSVVGQQALRLAAEELSIVTGTSDRAPDPKDRRFSDPAWQGRGWKRVAQSYLAFRDVVMETIDEVGLDPASADRARFGLMQVTEALAPSNNLITNPPAIRRAIETRGQSLKAGARHLAHDLRHNGGIPSQVDTRPFELGRNMAATKGAVVHRTDQFELLQFAPLTAKVRKRPIVIIPPQINRYYFLDLAPNRSLVEHAVKQGQQVFLISWRNPKPEHRSWSLDTYISACIEAIETAIEITGSKTVNTLGLCAGGMTESLLLGYLAAKKRPLVHAASLAVTMIDTHAQSVINSFATKRSVGSTINKSRKRGLLQGDDLAKVFAWIRPNDLIWNYWVNNYLMGENPPAFDVLAWNADATNLPNQLHEQFLQISLDNLLMQPGGVTVLGQPIDLSQVTIDMYSVGATTDHIVPWQSCYQATQAFSGSHRFVLSNSGHIQALVNPPDNPKASYFVGEPYPADPATWLKRAEQTRGSWWTDWTDWLSTRSGTWKVAPTQLGDTEHPVLCDAPGTYVTS